MTPDQARGRVRHAIEIGRLVRKPCEVCGNLKTDAHHDDYDRPLDVRWLCRKHHRQLHSKGVTPTVTVRASLLPWEHREIRKLAITRSVTVAQLVGDALRDALLKGAKP